MKVIAQLAAYLSRRGLLSAEQLAQLGTDGYLARGTRVAEAGDLLDHSDADPCPPTGTVRPGRGSDRRLDLVGAVVDLGEPLAVRRPGLTPRPARAAARRQRRARIQAALRASLRERLPTWEEPLVGLTRLAHRLGPAPSWPEAARLLRKATPAAVEAALVAGLAARAPSLPQLWDALSFDPWMEAPVLPPAARNLYVALLDAACGAAWGCAPVLPRGAEMAALCNLVQARQRVLDACGRMYEVRPGLLARTLRRDHHPEAYLAFILVHTARHYPATPASVLGGRPRRPLPADASWVRAYELASAIDPRHVVPFLDAMARGQAEGEEYPLICPADWDRA